MLLRSGRVTTPMMLWQTIMKIQYYSRSIYDHSDYDDNVYYDHDSSANDVPAESTVNAHSVMSYNPYMRTLVTSSQHEQPLSSYS